MWRELDDNGVTYEGPARVLPAAFDVTGLAAATVGTANLAAAELLAARRDEPVRAVRVDRRQACAAFLSEALFSPRGWQRPAAWDPIAGDYPARDGWVRLHTNYRTHRAAVERVLGPVPDRTATAGAVASWSARDLQEAVVDAGGCAAAMHDRATWLAAPAGAATAREPLVRQVIRTGVPSPELAGPVAAPLAGVRVLDLTRVIAGPVCTRFLAAYGADVLRIDPPGFTEVPALLPETTAGKRCAALDLTDPADRLVFEALLGQAHVLVTGLRPGALDRLGFDGTYLGTWHPHLITASLDAYGWTGPWSGRRGFDSLVQMSTGIAAAAGTGHPKPLPAQALDHGTGYVLAASVCRALTRLVGGGGATDIHASLVGTANVLVEHPTPEDVDAPAPDLAGVGTEETSTAWGPARRIRVPGTIEGLAPHLPVDAGPLGRHKPTWSETQL